MKQLLSFLLLLVGCHLIAADDGIIDRCSMKCSQYMICMENQASGKPEFKTCTKPLPPCNCGPMPEIQQGEAKVANDGIIDMCDVGCERYLKCRKEMSSGPCLIPSGCKCSQLPNVDVKQKRPCLKPDCDSDEQQDKPLMDFCSLLCNKHRKCLSEKNPQKPCVLPPACNCQLPTVSKGMVEEKRPNIQCMETCRTYWECRLGGGQLKKPNLSCLKPAGCMCDCFSAGVCSEIDIMPKSAAVEEIPRDKHCPIEVCGSFWNCQVEKMGRPEKQELECIKPHFCLCECLDEGLCTFHHFMRNMDEQKPTEIQAVEKDQCSNEKCADFWMCSWMAVKDEQLVCLKPQGCACSCAAAGICAQADIPAIARLAFGAQFIWPPPVAPMHNMKCSYACSKFSLCKKLFGAERCQLTSDCNCGMLAMREVEPEHA